MSTDNPQGFLHFSMVLTNSLKILNIYKSLNLVLRTFGGITALHEIRCICSVSAQLRANWCSASEKSLEHVRATIIPVDMQQYFLVDDMKLSFGGTAADMLVKCICKESATLL